MYCFHHPLAENGFFFDLEDRYEDILEVHPLLKKHQWSNCLVYDANFDVDHKKTFKKVESTLKKVFEKPEIELIVLDGISDLRRMAADLWSHENEKIPYGAKAWGEINNKVKKVLYRLFNYARAKKKTVILTAWLVDEYDNDNNKTGIKAFDAKEYIRSKVDETIMAKRVGMSFKLKRGKSALGPCKWTNFDLKVNEDDEDE